MHAVWSEQDFLVALSGCGRLAESHQCEEWLKKFGGVGWRNFKRIVSKLT